MAPRLRAEADIPTAAGRAGCEWRGCRRRYPDHRAFAARVGGALMQSRRGVDEDGLHRADRGLAAVGSRFAQAHMPQLAQGVLAGDAETRPHEVAAAFAGELARRGGDRQPRRVDRLLHGHAVVDQVERDVEHRVDDGGAAGRAVGGDRLAFPEQQHRRHA